MKCPSGLRLPCTCAPLTSYRDKIYFDGALPLIKREIRLKRLEKMRISNQNLYNGTPSGFQGSISRRHVNIGPDRLFTPCATAARLTSVSRTAFIVAAVIEDLKKRWTPDAISSLVERLPDICSSGKASAFKDRTEVIYGEADVSCADFARKHGSSVLSQDSDIFLYNLGSASLIFLDSLTLTENGLLAREWRPDTIARRLGIKSVQHLAFEIKRDPSAGLNTLVQRSKRVYNAETSCEFVSFLDEYNIQTGVDTQNAQIFDPRISELYAQFNMQQFTDESDSPRIYLPIQLENYTRSTAWAQGSDIRSAAYSVLNQSLQFGARKTSVTEFMRKGNRIAPVDVPLFSEDMISGYLQYISDKVEAVRQVCYNDCPPTFFWKIFAICELFTNSPKEKIDFSLLKQYLETGRRGDRLQWNDIHMHAQIEVILYSLTILGTFTRLALNSLEGNLKAITTKCAKYLEDIPSVQNAAMMNASETAATRCAEVICSILGDNVHESHLEGHREKSSKRRQKRRREPANLTRGRQRAVPQTQHLVQLCNDGPNIPTTILQHLNHTMLRLINGKLACSFEYAKIPPGETMTYRWRATQYGSTWYHSHWSLQFSEGLYGPLIIHGPATADYDVDLGPVFISDWYHQTAFTTWAQAERQAVGVVVQSDTGLINGKNKWDTFIGDYEVFEFEQGKKYLLRIIAVQTDSWMRFAIDGHTLTVIATDLVPIRPFRTSSLNIAPGQRYDVVVEADAAVENYWMRSIYQIQCSNVGNANPDSIKAIVRYKGAIELDPLSDPGYLPPSCEDEAAENLIPHVEHDVGFAGDSTQLSIKFYQGSDKQDFFQWTVGTVPLVADWSNPTNMMIQNHAFNFPPDANIHNLNRDGEVSNPGACRNEASD
ncbi:laccase, multicopper oxidase, benzenediol:oxygen oxidorectuctase [Ascosphaera pollenicola]|nr:laccase, multicopper oxidase, benzenediol:oxygen oxidorectuctase [Ascosphaera pollenicola]